MTAERAATSLHLRIDRRLRRMHRVRLAELVAMSSA
jgi:hypothetical protein